MRIVNARTLMLEVEPQRLLRASGAGPSSNRAMEIAAMFGLYERSERDLMHAPQCPIELPLPGPGVVFITGPSGAGKSTLLRSIAARCRDSGVRVIDIQHLPPIDEGRPLIDLVGRSLEEATSLLSLAGLAEASIMLRTPAELSDGQRCRFVLARAMELARSADERPGTVIVADEFGAALDRLTAKVMAQNVRRWIERDAGTPLTLIAACANDDLLEALRPDVLVWLSLDGEMHVHRRKQ